jgi:hypothetical protein
VTSVSHLRQDSRRAEILSAYQPVLQLAGKDILAAGMAQGILRRVEAASTAGLLMTIYLGSISYLDEQGRLWLAPGQVSDFALSTLRQEMWAKKAG